MLFGDSDPDHTTEIGYSLAIAFFIMSLTPVFDLGAVKAKQLKDANAKVAVLENALKTQRSRNRHLVVEMKELRNRRTVEFVMLKFSSSPLVALGSVVKERLKPDDVLVVFDHLRGHHLVPKGDTFVVADMAHLNRAPRVIQMTDPKRPKGDAMKARALINNANVVDVDMPADFRTRLKEYIEDGR